MYDVEKIRADFPILGREVNGKPLTYLDNGASAQKPQVVIDAITRAYEEAKHLTGNKYLRSFGHITYKLVYRKAYYR